MNKSEFTDDINNKKDSDNAEFENAAAESNATISNIDAISDDFDFPELSAEFQEEYKQMMTENLPDLWSRIESALPEKTVPVFANGKAVENRETNTNHEAAANRTTITNHETGASAEIMDFTKQDRQDKKEKTKKRFHASRYAILIAACICGLLVIPAVILSRTGSRFLSDSAQGVANETTAATEEMADAFYAEECDDAMEESCEEAYPSMEQSVCEEAVCEDAMGTPDDYTNNMDREWSAGKEMAEGGSNEAAIKDLPAGEAESPSDDEADESIWEAAEEESTAATDDAAQTSENTGSNNTKETEENIAVLESIFEKVTAGTLTDDKIILQDINGVVSGVNLTILENYELETGEILYLAMVEDRSFQMPVGDEVIKVPTGRQIFIYSGQRITNEKGRIISSTGQLEINTNYSCDLYPVNISREKAGEGYEFYLLGF